MKKIIPFTKEIPFKSKINEITSISLEHDLSFANESLTGNFYVKGKYTLTEASKIETDFSYKIPFEITISDKYDISNADSDIEDFYYEVIDEEILKVNIEVYIDGLEEKEIIEEEIRNTEEVATEEISKLISLDEKVIKNHLEKEHLREEPIVKVEDVITNINSKNDENYLTYSVYIFRENDTIEEVLKKYNTTKEILMEYNNLEEIKLGSKLVIPTTYTHE